MKKLTDEEWEHLLEILHALRHGKKIQTYFTDEWREEDDIELYDLFGGPMGYRVRPEPKTVTVNVYRNIYDARHWITEDKMMDDHWECLYSFEHEVWQ